MTCLNITRTQLSFGVLTLIFFLLMFSLYWALSIHKNITHTTTAGVTATWYFSKNVYVNKPTYPSLKRTLTTSFGSVCLGSLIVGLLKALRSLIKSQRRNVCCCCIVKCLLVCMDKLIRYFNMYAFVHCAIYGTNYIKSAKQTWSMFESKGLTAIINDDLTGLALFCGGFLSMVICFFTSILLLPVFSPSDKFDQSSVLMSSILVGIIGSIIGYMLCVTVLQVVRSSVVALFVCFAEDPNALSQNRPSQYKRLVETRPELNKFAQEGHTGIGGGVNEGLVSN